MFTWVWLGIAIVGTIAALIYKHHNKKRFSNATSVDTAVWGLYIISIAFAFAFYFSAMFLPRQHYFLDINPDDTQERKIEKLIERDEQNREYLNELRDVMFLQSFAIGVYLWAIAMFIGTIQKKRKIELLESDSETKNPLGL